MMAPFGGFDHNGQSLRVVTRLEERYAAFLGLNLTWETLEGVVKHNGPLTLRDGSPIGPYRERGLPPAILLHGRSQDLELWSFAGAEAQVAAIADDKEYILRLFFADDTNARGQDSACRRFSMELSVAPVPPAPAISSICRTKPGWTATH